MGDRPLLSICIPTYNRADALKVCIESIVRNKAYCSNIIEIVVSDNASTDGTSELMSVLCEKYENILYNRNEENIGGEKNFIKVLNVANGKFLKLHNDYCVFTEKGLDFILKTIHDNQSDNPFIFIDTRNYLQLSAQKCTSLDQYVKNECLNMTWISSYIFYSEDFYGIEDKEERIEIQFMQVDWGLKIFSKKGWNIICYGDIMHRADFKSHHGDYNLVNIFSRYPKIYQPYIENGMISLKTKKECCITIFKFMMMWYYNLHIKKDKHYSYQKDKNFSALLSYMKDNDINYIWLTYLAKVVVFDLFDNSWIIKQLRLLHYKMKTNRIVLSFIC